MPSGPPIVLTTDFGSADPYVGVMKGVILSINPQASIIDLSHQIQPQNLPQAAFILGASHHYFPPDAIHVVVVDPGVGTGRSILLLVTPTARFLAPDNGVLSRVLLDHLPNHPHQPGRVPDSVLVPDGCSVYALSNPEYWLQPVSNTFHGRDIFAPVAAHLSLGVEPAALGERVDQIAWLPSPQPVQEGEVIRGQVIYQDHFGNLITNIPERLLTRAEPGTTTITVTIKGESISGLSRTFHDEPDPSGKNPAGKSPAGKILLALIGSHGYLEIAVRDGSAAQVLPAQPGEPVSVIITGTGAAKP